VEDWCQKCGKVTLTYSALKTTAEKKGFIWTSRTTAIKNIIHIQAKDHQQYFFGSQQPNRFAPIFFLRLAS
jgi:hypothetical protein